MSFKRCFARAAVLLLCLLSAAEVAVARAGCSGGDMCGRSDLMSMHMEGLGPIAGNLFGYTDAFYGVASPEEVARGVLAEGDSRGSCEQPSVLTDRRFEFAGRLPGVGAARLYLDPTRPSRGEVLPTRLPDKLEDKASTGGLFPAVNEMRFFLRLDLPEMGKAGLYLTNVHPLTVRAHIDEWPPPRGTVYRMVEPVEFRERDPETGAPVGPVLATIAQESTSCFHGGGPLEVSVEAKSSQGRGPVRLEGQIRSSSRDPLEAVWHLYSRGRLVELDTSERGHSLLGPHAGQVELGGSRRSSSRVRARVKLHSPGSEFVSFMAASAKGNAVECDGHIFGDQAAVRVVRADRGLRIDLVEPAVLEAGTEATLNVSGASFQEPLALSVSGSGVDVIQVEQPAENHLRVRVRVEAAADPTRRDLHLRSREREFLFVEAFTVVWPPPVVHRVEPSSLAPGREVELTIDGDFFPALSSVSLGQNVEVHEVVRRSRRQLLVRASVSHKAAGTADVIVVGANGTGGLGSGLHLGEAEPKTGR